MKAVLTRDRVVGIGAIMVSAVIYWLSQDIPRSKVSGDIGSKAFPMISVGILAICGLILIFRKSPGTVKIFLLPHQWFRIGLLFTIYIIYALALNYFGFLVSTPAFLYGLCALLAKYAQQKAIWWEKVLFSLLLTGTVYCLFQIILHVTLPKGLLF